MSQVSFKSPKHCANLKLNVFGKNLFFAFSQFLTSVLTLILLFWLILHPRKPYFYLKEANIYQPTLSTPHLLLNSSIQITLLSENPNRKLGIYYDEFGVYAAYKGQQINLDASLPPFYQGHEDRNLLTASLIGTSLRVASSFGYEVGHDQTAGRLVLSLKVNGRLRWKVGTWVSALYRFNAKCVAVMPFGPPLLTGPLSLKHGTHCSTTI